MMYVIILYSILYSIDLHLSAQIRIARCLARCCEAAALRVLCNVRVRFNDRVSFRVMVIGTLTLTLNLILIIHSGKTFLVEVIE